MGWDEVGRQRRAKSRRVLSHREQLSREQGAAIKDWGGRLPVALVYPNSYYIGMSNLGIHAIYRLLNGYSDVVCERVFGNGKPILSLESRRRLADFAVLAFSVSYELDYFNVARMLKDSDIPLYAADRDDRHPLLIAGGACITANPMPLAPFFDCLCIGEAETIIPAMLPVISDGDLSREDILRELAKLPGLYVPQHQGDKAVARQWLRNLDDYAAGSAVITRDTELGDLYMMEVERGCGWGCRFCLVSGAFCPLRFRSMRCLLQQAEEGLRYRKRLGLVGPVVTDHPQIKELLSQLRRMGAGLSLSSLRVSPLSVEVLREVVRGGARTITLAPEAGSQRLRNVIAKHITEDDILAAASKVAGEGVKQLKLYFMFGLPAETDDDIEEMIRLVKKCKAILDRGGCGCRLGINVTPFIPKAGTPFQWLPMAPLVDLERRLTVLKKELPPLGIEVRGESPAWSQVQAALARGDAGMAGAVAAVEKVSLAGWRRVAEQKLDLAHYVLERWDTAVKLPWDVIDLGIPKERLIRELNEAMAQ